MRLVLCAVLLGLNAVHVSGWIPRKAWPFRPGTNEAVPSFVRPLRATIDGADERDGSDRGSWAGGEGPPPVKHPTEVDRTGVVDVFPSVFKLKVTACAPLFRRPWSKQPTGTSFSTAWAYDVEQRLLLTNSHCVTDAVVVNVKKPGNSSLFKAEVLCRSDYADLALLRVPDDNFWEGVKAIKLEQSDVKLGDLVNVIGYPRGGEKICITKGVVSRLHFNGDYLSIQIDAAINPGNSGGPVLNENNDCVGVAYRKRVDRGSENIGYIIPVEVIRHFLEDYRRHNTSIGMCLQGFEFQDMTNPALKDSIGMPRNETGCLVMDVAQWTNAAEHLKKDDVVLSIDGNRLQDDKTVPYRDGDYIPFEYLWSYKFVGGNVSMEILRNGTKHNITWEMQKRHPILPTRPAATDHLMIGGMLFLPLSWEIYDPDRSTRNLRSFCESVRRVYADEEVVVLSEIFPHPINEGYLPPRLARLTHFNEHPVRNLSHLTTLVEDFKGDWMKFRVESNLQHTIVLDARDKAVWNATQEICSTYSVPYYKARPQAGEIPPWLRPEPLPAPEKADSPIETEKAEDKDEDEDATAPTATSPATPPS